MQASRWRRPYLTQLCIPIAVNREPINVPNSVLMEIKEIIEMLKSILSSGLKCLYLKPKEEI